MQPHFISVLFYPISSDRFCFMHHHLCQHPLNIIPEPNHAVVFCKSCLTSNINQYHDVKFRHTHTHSYSLTLFLMSHIKFGISVLTNTLQLHQVMSTFFHWNFTDRRENRWCEGFLSYSLHCKMMHWLYLWTDISLLSYILHAKESKGVWWPTPKGGCEVKTKERLAWLCMFFKAYCIILQWFTDAWENQIYSVWSWKERESII